MARPVRVAVSPLALGEIELDEPESRYLVRVHRLRDGDRFVAFDPAAKTEAEGEIVSSSPRRVRCRIESIRPSERVSTLPVTLFQALGKGDKPDRVIRDATALGAAAIVLVETERSVAKPGADRAERWRTIAVEAARQSGRGDVPEVSGPVSFEQALTSAKAFGVRIVLDPRAERNLREVLGSTPLREPMAVLIGPEGGLSDGEMASLAEAGFESARFGAFTLRTETAATALLGALVALAELG
jgi:16S rRNA (uracil1498-N3)-methyltransferase